MSYGDEILHSLQGDVIDEIDQLEDEIRLTMRSGKTVRILHHQDCCESVRIVGTDGDWKDIKGEILVSTSISESSGGDAPSEYAESWTRTNIEFKTDSHTVISRWIGTSNGYYSESLTIEQL